MPARAEPQRPAARDDGVQSLVRAFGILERMAASGGEVGLSELAAGSGIPLATVHRLVRTLVALGYVRQQPSRRYAMAPRLIGLGEAAGRLVGEWARPHLTQLVQFSGESANLARLDGDEAVYVAHVASRHSMRMFTEVGRRVLPHCTGVGKAILAQLPEERVLSIVGRTGLPATTPRSITSAAVLLRALDQIREQGFAVDDGEQEAGVRCVAMAVPGGSTPYAVSVSGPEGRMTDLAIAELTDRMRGIAQDLAAAVG